MQKTQNHKNKNVNRPRATTLSGRDERTQTMETTRLARGRKRPRPPCASVDGDPKDSRGRAGRHRAPIEIFEVSPRLPSTSTTGFTDALSRPGKSLRGVRHPSSCPGAWKAAATALFVFVVISVTSLPSVAGTAFASGLSTGGGGGGSKAGAASASRLCSPADSARAYVTTLASCGGKDKDSTGSGQVLGARVLAQSLRSAGAKGDIVVLVPMDRATAANVESLRRDGLTVQIVPRGLLSGMYEYDHSLLHLWCVSRSIMSSTMVSYYCTTTGTILLLYLLRLYGFLLAVGCVLGGGGRVGNILQ